jgi:hypothetical protein
MTTDPIFHTTKDEHAVDMMAHSCNSDEDRRRFDHDHSFTVPEQDRAFRNGIQLQRAQAKLEIIALAKHRNVDPSTAIWMHRGHGKIEEQEKPPPVVVQLRKAAPKKRKPLIVEKRIPPVVLPPIVLQSLQRHSETVDIQPPSSKPETSAEIMRRLNWATRDASIRKRRANLNSTARL